MTGPTRGGAGSPQRGDQGGGDPGSVQYSGHLEQAREYFAYGEQPAGLRKAVSPELWAVLTVAAYLPDE
jgi:hypothetical protein